MNEFWSRRTCVILTGASKGIGQELAVEISRLLIPDSAMVLIARSTVGLENTKYMVNKENKDIFVEYYSVDLYNSNALMFEKILEPIDQLKYELYLLIHNAGSVGNLDHLAADMNDPDEWNRYMSLNLYSVACLTSVFLAKFNTKKTEKCIVNITSLFGIEAKQSVGYYCVGKASREMYFRVLAKENPTLNILSYSPGPILTDMTMQISANCKDQKLREEYKIIRERDWVKVEDTCKKLVNVLAMRNYQTGSRIDYYDV
ncbi:sepiapterin reductase-like [Daktulosphaira vitifoliae]|uniref:sepiapterin reductase-like n=1 Tax=Daktulosphaira vitifoliae TaxID=58002 RepID=UPI0021AA2A3A|nr:sepiapterin reductase-like [Daktulosphaira vitifoliae]XP_050533921.1 sepiapterin reductase-like [Daktulosphaira vitifoliae]XP_050533922.1 sepiapterin reductase-like [Daktulosphaira vitifoliae]XP_050533923.1 sepiapterin reductase-like [Daktulosphaira vitifoliae]